MSDTTGRFMGPRVPQEEISARRGRYLAPTLLFAAAAILLIVSTFLPYWQLTLNAPQYPGGLTIEAYLDHLEGDVGEIDGLNHYIGMRPLAEAAPFEKSISIIGVIAVSLLILAAVFVHTRWVVLLVLPALLFSHHLPGRSAILAGQLRDKSGSRCALVQQRRSLRAAGAFRGQDRPVQHLGRPVDWTVAGLCSLDPDPRRPLLPPTRLQAAGGCRAHGCRARGRRTGGRIDADSVGQPP